MQDAAVDDLSDEERALAAQEGQKRDYIVEQIRAALYAFPGITASMLHPLVAKRCGKGWTTVLDELIQEGKVLRAFRPLDKRAVVVFYWHDYVRPPLPLLVQQDGSMFSPDIDIHASE